MSVYFVDAGSGDKMLCCVELYFVILGVSLSLGGGVVLYLRWCPSCLHVMLCWWVTLLSALRLSLVAWLGTVMSLEFFGYC